MKPRLRAIERSGFRIAEVRGHEDVLAHCSLLAELADRCGQRGAVDHLSFRFSDPYFGAKLPSLFLFFDSAGPPTSGSRPAAAVLMNEYRLLGMRTGVYMPADLSGDWTILAAPEIRAEVAQQTAAHLLGNGAHIVLLSFLCKPMVAPVLAAELPPPIATAERTLLRTLPLHGTVDDTLATMGSHTRRNLRLARRQAVKKLRARFVAEAELSEDEFLLLNREGFYPVPDRVARWRYGSALESAGGFITGVCTVDGEWLALLGGRRHLTADGPCTAVDWQWNRTSFARFSPGSLMRMFLIEHELLGGSRRLRFEGGTPHTMRSAFDEEHVCDLLYARPWISGRSLRLLGRLLPKGNLLGEVLVSGNLRWQR